MDESKTGYKDGMAVSEVIFHKRYRIVDIRAAESMIEIGLEEMEVAEYKHINITSCREASGAAFDHLQ